MRKKKSASEVPDKPADPENYILVTTREKIYWRKKRGTIKKAKLNKSFKKNISLNGIASPAARQIKIRLAEFLEGMDTGRFIGRISGRLRKAFNKTGEWNYSEMKRYEFQPYYLFAELFDGPWQGKQEQQEYKLQISLFPGCVRQLNKDISGFFFDLISLSGDPSKPGKLLVDSDTSPLYDFNSKEKFTIRVSIPDKKPWMVLLSVKCMDGKKIAQHPRHKGMIVVEVG